ncbi:hypothetical protein ACO1O0_000042 [Amphichorda felina]
MQFPFTLAADPNTDLWRKPPSTDDCNAPSSPHSKGPLLSLLAASISFTCPYTTQFDQAGILLTFTHPSAPARKWIKAGIEFFQGRPRLSVVCCDRYSDWSVTGLPADSPAGLEEGITAGKAPVTISLEKDGTTLWVYYVNAKGEKQALREIAWVYGENDGEGWEVEVGVLVARPNKDIKGQLEATFQSLDVEWEK